MAYWSDIKAWICDIILSFSARCTKCKIIICTYLKYFWLIPLDSRKFQINVLKQIPIGCYGHYYGKSALLFIESEFYHFSYISSHVLEIERGRYQKPKVPRDLRLCRICNVVEDEEHFVTSCSINHGERSLLYSIMTNKIPYFGTLSDNENFLFLITNNDPQILTWFGKFLHRSFIIRNEVLISKVDD